MQVFDPATFQFEKTAKDPVVMILSHRTDFAFRTLMFLGKAAKESPSAKVTTAQIAAAFDIPANHLIKIVNELAHRGYVRTVRGPGGGVTLAPNAAQLRLGNLIESLQGPMHLHECVESDGSCAIESICKLRGIFRQADAVQRDFLNQFTLADIVPAPTAA